MTTFAPRGLLSAGLGFGRRYIGSRNGRALLRNFHLCFCESSLGGGGLYGGRRSCLSGRTGILLELVNSFSFHQRLPNPVVCVLLDM